MISKLKWKSSALRASIVQAWWMRAGAQLPRSGCRVEARSAFMSPSTHGLEIRSWGDALVGACLKSAGHGLNARDALSAIEQESRDKARGRHVKDYSPASRNPYGRDVDVAETGRKRRSRKSGHRLPATNDEHRWSCFSRHALALLSH